MFKLMPTCVILLFAIASLPSTKAAYNVVSFGAKPDGQSDSTLPFLRAWMAACNSVAPAMVYVPRGTFLIKNAVFSGPCKNRILFQIQGTLVAPWDYRSLGNSGFWILFQKVSRLTVSGGGTVDGRGAGFWTCRRTGSNCPYGTRSITFLWCNNIVVSGLTSIKSQLSHFAVARCNNLRIQNVRIIAPSNSPNTDGIIVQDSTGVTISRSIIRTGDDCIAIGPNTKNVWIERIGCGPGHGISIGSLGNGLNENGVQNVTVTNSVFTKTDNGVRIKSWARASNSYATNINFRNLIMRNVANPILIDQTYCPNNQCPRQTKMADQLVVSWVVMLLIALTALFWKADAATYNVITFGAKPDGQTDSTRPFLQAWAAACGSAQAATISVPRGRYLLGNAVFRGPCKNRINFQISGTLVAPADYRALGNTGYWILFIQVNGVTVVGGSLDAKGAGFWACRRSGSNCPVGARSITFNWANDIVVSGLTSINSQLSHLVINSCNNVRVSNVRLIAPYQSPNTDGIHVQGSTGVTITGSSIKTGDDCISIGPGTKNLWMERITCGPGHGVSIGSLGKLLNEAGVQNVTLTNSVFSGSDNGLRIKTWARPSNGFVTNILYQNIVMKNVKNPIIIDQNYCPTNQGCPG
ncbi:hypothetical protein RJ640_000154, partial [Escallonia rubra]